MTTTPSPSVAAKSCRPSGRLLSLLIGFAALSTEALLVLGPGARTVLPSRSLPTTTSSLSSDGSTVHRRPSASIRLVREDSDASRRISVPRRTPQPSPPRIW